MRVLTLAVITFVISAPTIAQKNAFPLTAKVVSSGEETVPGTGGVTTAATSPQVRAQFPNAPATHTVRVRPETYIATKVELDEKIYILRGGRVMDPGSYPASVDGRTVRLLTKDRHGKPQSLKFYVLSVEATERKP